RRLRWPLFLARPAGEHSLEHGTFVMNRFFFGLLWACGYLLGPAPCKAAEEKPGGRNDAAAEKVVAAALEATKKMEWERFADLMHPEALQDFQKMLAPLLQAADKKGPRAQAELVGLFEGATDIKAILAWK